MLGGDGAVGVTQKLVSVSQSRTSNPVEQGVELEPREVQLASQRQQRGIAQADLPEIIEPSFSRSSGLPSVDWVHSDGAVRFFSDPKRNSTMIWVKKRSPVMRYYAAASGPKSVLTPQIRDQETNPVNGAPFAEAVSQQRVVTR